jgi:DNA-binding MurR/RpiR family transcriptional regulator
MPETASSFTAAELAVLRYIQVHGREAAELSTRELAEAAGCSAATVVRLSRKLGYSGYAEYRFALRRQKHPPVSASGMPERDILAEIAAVSHLNQAREIERTADLFAERDTIILVGGGLTHTALEYLHHYLFSASCPTICMPNDELSLDAISSAPADAVVLCASVSGIGSTLDLAREAHNRGLFVVGITSSLTSELITFCDIHLLATSAPRTNPRIASRLGIIAVTDEIARTYTHRHLHGQVVAKEAQA